jgi:hypothetical protein
VSRRRAIWQRIRQIWATLGTTALLVFLGWSWLAYRATPAAYAPLATRLEQG